MPRHDRIDVERQDVPCGEAWPALLVDGVGIEPHGFRDVVAALYR